MVVVITAERLDLDDNTTCQLIRSHHSNIHFYTVDIKRLASQTPLGIIAPQWNVSLLSCLPESFFRSSVYERSDNSVVHLSDALRVLLVWRYGGLYLDTDYVVLNDMTHYQNVTVKTGAGGLAVTNNAFSFTAGHPFLLLVMLHMSDSYRPGCWTCIGPELLTKSLRQYNGTDVTLVPMVRVLTVNWQRSDQIIDSRVPISFEEWKEIFQNSSSIHFSGAVRANLVWQLPDDPQYSAYAVLGPRYCPLSYYSVRYF